MNWRRCSILSLLLILGCGHLATPQEKEASFQAFVAVKVGRVSLRDFIEERTAILVAGAEPGDVEVHDNQIGVRLKPLSPDGKMDFASASALSEDGYYLTAGHCVHRRPVFLIVPTNEGPRTFMARVVWQPPQDFEYCDLAVLKVNPGGSELANFDLAADSDVTVGDAVVTTGANGEAAGHLLRAITNDADPAHGLPVFYALIHDAPLTRGDSGGPMTTLDGKLIGVQVLVRGFYIGPSQAIALRPDSHWLVDIIHADRLAHPTSRPAQ
jgi:S1-C subfamily serine protease